MKRKLTRRYLISAVTALLTVLLISVGIALAAGSFSRTANLHFYDPLDITITPSTAVNLNIPYGGSDTEYWSCTNPTPNSYNVTCTNSAVPTGVTVAFSPQTFALAAGASQNVGVTFSNTLTSGDNVTDLPITLYFTPAK